MTAQTHAAQQVPDFPALRITMNARVIASAVRILALTVAGSAPVLAIPVFVFELAHIHDSALFVVLPAALLAVALAIHRSVESLWAVRGLLAGLIAVAAYDALRMPFVLAGIWPDFIPRLGAWVLAADGENAPVGYLWRYLGDGGGMGLVFFLACAILGIHRDTWLGRRAVALGVGYGVFVWSGLIGTVAFSVSGAAMLFPLSPMSIALSLAGHLVYGSVLGLGYRLVIQREPLKTRLSAGASG